MPAPINWNLGLQILRGVAATMVVTAHCLSESHRLVPGQVIPDWAVRLGTSGVDLFFVISGFIMFSVTYGRPGRERAGPFLTKRFIRIFPLYWICLFTVLLLWSTGFLYRSMEMDPYRVVASLFLLPGHQIIFVAWTLVYEMYFYYLFSLALFFRDGLRAVAATTLLICAGLLAGHLLPGGFFKESLSDPLALEFCYGLGLGLAVSRGMLTAPVWRYLYVPGFIAIALAVALLPEGPQHAPEPRWLVWGLPACLVVAAFIRMPLDLTRTTRLLIAVGDASYAIYLTHPMFLISYDTLVKHGLNLGVFQFVLTPFFVAGCLFLGWLVHRWIERPIIAGLRSGFGLLALRDASS